MGELLREHAVPGVPAAVTAALAERPLPYLTAENFCCEGFKCVRALLAGLPACILNRVFFEPRVLSTNLCALLKHFYTLLFNKVVLQTFPNIFARILWDPVFTGAGLAARQHL